MSFDDTQNNVIYSGNGNYKVTAYGEVIFGDDDDKYSLGNSLIEMGVDGRPSEPILVLSSRGGNKIGAIQNVRSINITHPLSDVAELSFDVYKEINGITYSDWDKIKDFKFVQMPHDNSWFEAKVTLDEENDIVKHVTCVHANEAELGQLNLYDVEINTDADIERDDYVETFFYNEDNPNASLLHRILKDKAPHYQIYHVDNSLKGLWRSFSFSGTSIQDALNQIAEEVGCLFVYGEWFENDGKYHRTISAYDLEDYCYTCGKRGNYTEHVCTNCGSTNIKYGYGEDTGIFISKENLATSINYESNTDEVKNCFRLVAGDDVMTAAIKSCNPSMSQYMWHFSDDMLEDMSEELRNKIIAYQTLVSDYQTTTTMDIGRTYVNNYNTLVNKYTDYNDELVQIDYPIVGTSKLTEAYYNAVNLYGFIKSELMPSSEKVESTTALEQLEILQENGNMDEVGISSVSDTIPYTSANSAIQSFAKVYVDTSRYKVTVLTNDIVGTEWTGTIVIESYTDDEDTASDTLTITLFDSTDNNKYVDWINQSVQKAMANREVTDLSVTNLFDKDETLASFKEKIKGYSLDYLDIMNSMATSAITIMTEQGVANENSVDTDVYTQLYKPYLDKSRAIQDEIAVKETELSYLQRPIDEDGNTDPRFPELGLLDVIVEAQNNLAKTLDIHTYLGDELWTELSFYRREDEYQNSNYISDGLTDGEIIEQAQRFIESATKEIIKSSTLQHTISAPLIDFLIMPEFMKLQKKFKTGNWIHLMVDGKVYKLRLTNWTVDFDNIEDLDVEFSDVVRTGGSVSDIASILSKSRSMATTYDYTAKQANKGKDASDTIKIYKDYGIDFRKIKAITSKGNTNIVYDDDGILLKRVDGTETLPEQARIYNNGIYITKDAWETVSTGLGHYSYVDPETGETVQTYGIIADTVIGRLILGENLKIYSESGKLEMGDGGLKITAKGDTGNTDLFVVQKEKKDEQNRTYVEKYIYVDSDGEVKISGSSITLGGKPLVEYIDDAIGDADIDVSLPVTIQIDSSTGVIFNTNSISTTLTATVYRGGEDITSQITQFEWAKKDKDGNIDTSWTRTTTTNSINVNINNIDGKVIIGCGTTVTQDSTTTTASGSITISKIHDGSQFWTSATAPVSPDYTFNISDLVGDTNADIKEGDIIYYSHYRYTVTSVNSNGTTVLCGNRENLRGVEGISPTVKSIVCSHAAVVCEKDGSYNPTAVTFNGQAQTQDTIESYEGWFKIELSSDATTWVSSYTSSSKESFVNYRIPLGLNITKDGILYYQGSIVTTNGSVVDSNFTITSDGVIETTQDIGFIIRSIRCSLYSDANMTNLVDQQRVNIAFDGVDGDNGDDGYTVVLTNENHTFAGNTTSAINGDFTECEVIAYKGGLRIPTQIGTIAGMPMGMTVAKPINDATNSKFVVTVSSAMTTQNGVLDVPVTVEGKTFNMKFTYSLKLNGLDSTGLGWMVNYSTSTTLNDGECIYHGFDEVTKQPSYDKDGWVLWNGQEIAIPHGCFINPNDTMPYNTTIYSVYRLPTATTYTGGTFHDVAWIESTNSWRANTYNGTTPTANSNAWVWNEDTDIILAMYVEPSNDGTITNAQLFTPPKKYSELTEVAKGMAKDAEKVAYYYMVTEPSTGTMIADMSDGVRRLPSTVDDKRNILLTDTEIKIRDGQDDLASYGESIRIGQRVNPHMEITSTGMSAYKDSTNKYYELGDGSETAVQTYTVSELPLIITVEHEIEAVISITLNGDVLPSTAYDYASSENTIEIIDCPSETEEIIVVYTYATGDAEESEDSSSSTIPTVQTEETFDYVPIALDIDMDYAVGSGTTIASIYVNDNQLSANDYTLNTSTNVLTIKLRPTTGSVVRINYRFTELSPYFTFNKRKNGSTKGNASVSFADGGNASGDASFVIGIDTNATGVGSFSGGKDSTASGAYSGAIGEGVVASATGAFVCGKYNTQSEGDLFAIGNGTPNSRSDAFRVTGAGNATVYGDLQVKERALIHGQMRSGIKNGGYISMFSTKTFTKTVGTISADGTKSGIRLNITRNGYYPMAVSGIRILNSDGGANASKCNVYIYRIVNSSDKSEVVFSIANLGANAAGVKVEFTIFYIARNAVLGE